MSHVPSRKPMLTCPSALLFPRECVDSLWYTVKTKLRASPFAQNCRSSFQIGFVEPSCTCVCVRVVAAVKWCSSREMNCPRAVKLAHTKQFGLLLLTWGIFAPRRTRTPIILRSVARSDRLERKSEAAAKIGKDNDCSDCACGDGADSCCACMLSESTLCSRAARGDLGMSSVVSE